MILFILLQLCLCQIPQKFIQELNSKPISVHYCSIQSFEDERSQFILTEDGKIFKFQDNQFIQQQFNDLISEEIQIKSILETNESIYFQSDQHTFFTNDCGQNYDYFENPKNLIKLIKNPRFDILIAQTDIECEDECLDYYNFLVSFDKGKNFKTIIQFGKQLSFEIPYPLKQFEVLMPEQKRDRIYAIYLKNQSQNCTQSDFINDICQLSFDYSDDYFQTSQLFIEDGIQFFQTQHKLFIQTKKFLFSTIIMTSVLDHESQATQFTPVQLADPITQPILNEFKNQDNYEQLVERIKILENQQELSIRQKHQQMIHLIIPTFIQQTQYGVFMAFSQNEHINQEFLPQINKQEKQQSTLYHSDNRGIIFNLSLQNVNQKNNLIDIEYIKSIDGVFIANIRKQDQIVSLITYDEGGKWHFLQPPMPYIQQTNPEILNSFDSDIEKNGVSLHLVGQTFSQQMKPHSHEKSKGIIIGVGSIGNYLDYDNLNTYISGNGGIYWFEIKKGQHLFEAGDHGGIVVLVKNNEPTNMIFFSLDYGDSWQDFQFSDQQFKISQIIIDKEAVTQQFLLFTEKVIISIDFSNINERTCKGSQTPDGKESDYYHWKPKIKDSCFMGQNIVIIRRRKLAKCWNEQFSDSQKIISPCSCTYEDWECEFGFIRHSNKCLPLSKKYAIDKIKCGQYDNFIEQRSAYRKVPGNMCQGGPNKIDCVQQKYIEEQKKKELNMNLQKEITLQINKEKDKKIKELENQSQKIQNKKIIKYIDEVEKSQQTIKKQKPLISSKNYRLEILIIIMLFLIIILYFFDNLIVMKNAIKRNLGLRKKYPTYSTERKHIEYQILDQK